MTLCFSGLQTFEREEAKTEMREPEAKPEAKEEQKGENKHLAELRDLGLANQVVNLCASCGLIVSSSSSSFLFHKIS